MSITSKTLGDINKEVEDFERDKGWLDQDFSFGERMALLHSEVSEALEAYRDWGLKDMTHDCRPYDDGGSCTMPHSTKPEGVGAEFADIFIRLVGDCRRDGVDLEVYDQFFGGRFGLGQRFGEQMQTFHLLIDRLFMVWEDGLTDPVPSSSPGSVHFRYAAIYRYLTQLCELHGINLMAEYERKMAYNRTRPYRHGGKAL